MHDFERIIALPHVQFGERTPGAANRVKGATAQTVERKGASQLLPGDAQRGLGRAAGGVHQRQRAEFQRHAFADLRLPSPSLTSISSSEPPPRSPTTPSALCRVEITPSAESGPRARRKSVRRPANRLFRRREKLRAIRGVARGGRRHGTHVLYLHEFAEFSKPAQGFERLRHAVLGQGAGGRHALAKAAQAPFH